jgi:cell division protein FtsB
MENQERSLEMNLIELTLGIMQLRKKIADLEKENEKLKEDYDIICKYASNLKSDLEMINPEKLV